MEFGNETMIKMKNIAKRYDTRAGFVYVLQQITLDIREGEFITIMGPSGSGKSTFFNQVGALDVPTEGRVFFGKQSIFDLSESRQAWFRCNKIGYIFQTFNLIQVLTALENVALPTVFAGTSNDEGLNKAEKLLEMVSDTIG